MPETGNPIRGDAEKTPEQREAKFEILADRESRKMLWDRVNRLVDAAARQRFGVPVMVFLDKSARPLSWMFRARWQKRFPDTPVPEIRYMALGRRQVLEDNTDLVELHQDMSATLVTEENPWSGKRLREMYGASMQLTSAHDAAAKLLREKFFEEAGGHGLLDEYRARVGEIAGRYADLKDKRIIVVDDYSSTGASKVLAEFLLQDAIPGAVVQGVNLYDGSEVGKIPWIQTQGLAGVVELAGQQDLLAAPLNRETFEKVRSEIEARVSAYENGQLQDEIRTYRDRLDRLDAKLAEGGSKFDEASGWVADGRRMLDDAGHAGDRTKRVKAYGALAETSVQLYDRFDRYKENHPTLRNTLCPTFWVNADYPKAVEILNSLTSFEEIKAKSDGLRTEIAALAKLEADQF